MATGTTSLQYDFKESDEGLFVIIKQLQHKLNYHPQREYNYDWGTRQVLNYDADEERLLNLFNLQKKTKKPKQSSNLLIGEDLTNGNGNGNESFKNFMEKVGDYRKKKSPAFIMLFLMSHGFENGDFLLASPGVKRGNGTIESEKQCCLDKHTKEGKCFARNVVKDVISKVCEAYPEETIPKIFMLQCCRGGIEDNIDGRGKPHNAVSSETELFIPSHQDVFVFRASVEGYVSWVLPSNALADNPDGSLLIQSFCDALEEVTESDSQYQTLVEKVKEQEGEAKVTLLSKLQEPNRREDITGGWIMNVCQRTTTLVTNYMLINIFVPPTLLGELLKQDGIDTGIETDENKKLREEFLVGLENYKKISNSKDKVQRITKASNENEGHALRILRYMWLKFNSSCTQQSTNTIQHLISDIDDVLLEIKMLERRVALGKLLKDDETLTCILKGDDNKKKILVAKFSSSLEDYKKYSDQQSAVTNIQNGCTDNGGKNRTAILLYLWCNVRQINPIPLLLVQGMSNKKKSVLERDLNTIIEEIRVQEPYSKQQPHISSSLCKKLSFIKIMKTQEKATTD